MKPLFLSLSLMSAIAALADEKPKWEITKLSNFPFVNTQLCTPLPCFKPTPDSKGILLLNAQRQLIYYDSENKVRRKIADTACNHIDCVGISPDSSIVSYVKQEGEKAFLYKRSLNTLLENQPSPAKKVGELPRFAGQEIVNTHYELNFCTGSRILYVRADSNSTKGSVHAFDLNNDKSKELFSSQQGKASALKCHSEGAYFIARSKTAGSSTNEELLIEATSRDFANATLFRKVIHKETSPQYSIRIVDAVWTGQAYALHLESSNRDSFASSTLLLKKADAESIRLKIWDSRNILTAFRGANESEILFTNERDLKSISIAGSYENQLNENGFLVDRIFSFSTQKGNERMLFSETKDQQRNLVVSRLGGAQRYLLSQTSPFASGANNFNTAAISPSGKCVLIGYLPQQSPRLDYFNLESEKRVENLLPLKRNEGALGKVIFAPDSSYAIVLSDHEEQKGLYLYKVATPDCK